MLYEFLFGSLAQKGRGKRRGELSLVSLEKGQGTRGYRTEPRLSSSCGEELGAYDIFSGE